MSGEARKETFVEQKVNDVFEQGGRVVIVEHVPARVCVETGGRFFAPDIVERLQHIVWGQGNPTRVVETPAFEFAQA